MNRLRVIASGNEMRHRRVAQVAHINAVKQAFAQLPSPDERRRNSIG